MNIFILDKSPVLAAQYLVDGHINKMILESCQMMANLFTDEQLKKAPLTKTGTTWRHSHYNHPCSIWVRESKGNLDWLARYVIEIINERYYRWPKREPHDCQRFFNWVLFKGIKLLKFTQEEQTPFAIAIPETAQCRRLLWFDEMDVVRQYRAYYAKDKKHLHKWTNRKKPDFIP